MAGARPEHMPMLIAMVQSIGDPRYKVSYSRRAGSTHSFNTYYWVNGPVARQLGVDFGQGLIAHPINKVIGRAMSLIERNIAGYQIKLTQVGYLWQGDLMDSGRRRRGYPEDWLEARPRRERLRSERKYGHHGRKYRMGPEFDSVDQRSEDPDAADRL